MKRISLALAIGLSANALAALPAATDPTMVSLPQLPGGFFIGGSAYYLQPSATQGNLAFANHHFFNTFLLNTSTFVFNFGSFLKEFNPKYDWSWGINLGYIFPQTSNDINLSYFQLDTDNEHDYVFSGAEGFFTPIANQFFPVLIFNPSFGTAAFAKFVAARAEYELHQVDLTVGQYIDIGCRLVLHPNVGLRWAQLERRLSTRFAAPFVGGDFEDLPFSSGLDGFFNVFERSDFSGIGPVIGLDASYYIYRGFGVVTHADSALLVGSITNKAHNIYFSGGANPIIIPGGSMGFPSLNAIYDFSSDDVQRIVPVVDLKLGLNYTYLLSNNGNSDLTLELGWHFSNYFNAVDRLITNSTIIPSMNLDGDIISGSIFPGNVIGRKTSDYGIQGPYASLVFHF